MMAAHTRAHGETQNHKPDPVSSMDTCRSLTNDMAVIRVPVNMNEKDLICIVSTIYMLPPMIFIDRKSKGDIHKQAP